jgi:hypothetical protein
MGYDMSKNGIESRFNSEGHRLIRELSMHLNTGKPLSLESKKTWEVCLSGLFVAKNKKEAAEVFFRILELKFPRGARFKDHDHVVFWVEMYVLDGMTKEQAIEKAANTLGKEFEAINKRYYQNRSEEVRWYAEHFYNEDPSWRNGPKQGSMESPGHLILWRALIGADK